MERQGTQLEVVWTESLPLRVTLVKRKKCGHIVVIKIIYAPTLVCEVVAHLVC